jgi:cell division protein FtsW
LQPSEFAKLAIPAAIAWIAGFSNRHRISDVVRWWWMLIVIGVFLALVLAGNDLGNPIVMGIIGFVSVALAGMPFKWLWKVALAGLFGVLAFILFGPSWKAGRIEAWLTPEADPAGAGYQLLHGQYALAQGGWFGNGYGSSLEKWGALPAPHTDFILPVIAEEVGIVGTSLIFIGLYVLAVAAFRIGAKSKDLLGRLVGAGFGTWIGVQTVINVGGVNGMLPITGLPLPFVSYGGTSMFMMMVVVGILFVVERDNYEVRVAQRIAQQEAGVRG